MLRHVSPAFAEDPVRVLRVARFAARFADLGFTVAGETMALMGAMVAAGEVDALVPERVWQELAKALGEARPARFFEALRECGALARLLPELDRLWGVPQPAQWHPEVDTGVHAMLVLDMSARLSPDTEVRFAALCHDLGKGTTPAAILPSHKGHEERSVDLLEQVCDRFKVPHRHRDLARITARYHGKVHKLGRAAGGDNPGPFERGGRLSPAGALRADADRLRGGLPGPHRLCRASLPPGRASAPNSRRCDGGRCLRARGLRP